MDASCTWVSPASFHGGDTEGALSAPHPGNATKDPAPAAMTAAPANEETRRMRIRFLTTQTAYAVNTARWPTR